MSARGKRTCIKLLRDILAQRRLKGGLHERSAAVQRAGNLIVALRMAGDGRKWTPGNTECDRFVADLRKMAGDTRLGPALRSRSLVRLCVLEGFANPEILGNEPSDDYVRHMLRSMSDVKVSSALTQSFADVLKKVEEEHDVRRATT